MLMCLVDWKYVYLSIGGLKDHLGVPREGVWTVSTCSYMSFSLFYVLYGLIPKCFIHQLLDG